MKILTSILFIIINTSLAFSQIGTYALNFDGINDTISFSPVATPVTVTDLTIEGWIKPSSVTSNHQIFSWVKRTSTVNVIEFRLIGNILNFGINNGTWGELSSTNTINTSVWTYVAITKSGSTIKLYINGKKETNEGSINKSPIVNQLQIGYYHDDGANPLRFFAGSLDEIRVWTVARTEAEIKANMYKELSGSETGLYAYYKMNNGVGIQLTDNKSGGTNIGTISGASWKTSGCFSGSKYALDFDGTNEYVNISNGVVLGTNFTQEVWIYPTDVNANYHGILGYDDMSGSGGSSNVKTRPPCIYQYGKKIHFGFGDGSAWYSEYTNDVLKISEWNHIAVTFDGTIYKVYANGILVNSTNFASGKTPYGYGQNNIGRIDNYFVGKIDEVRIWNVVRTESQIKDNIMCNLSGNESGLVGYYRMDYNDGSTLYDITSNGKNGSLTNMETSDWVTSNAFNTWIGCDCGTFSVATNWSKGSVPGSSDNIGIYKWSSGNECTISEVSELNHLIITSGSNPTLNSSITVNGNLCLCKDFDLNGNTITLGSSGNLYESDYRLFGTSGTITTTRTLGTLGTDSNVAGLGILIKSTGDLGSTTITRGVSIHTEGGLLYNTKRYYDATVSGGYPLNLIFKYHESDLTGGSESNLKLFRSTDNGTNWIKIDGSVINTSNKTITITGVNALSRWTAADGDSPLPVNLLSFTSEVQKRTVILKWKTLFELNNKGFEIQKKNFYNNTSDWQNIGFANGNITKNEPSEYIFKDDNCNYGKYKYRLKQIDCNGNFEYFVLNDMVVIELPKKYELKQNYPNPFNPVTIICFEIPENSMVIIKLFDLLGREVKTLVNEQKDAGYYAINFDASDISSGIYFYKMIAGSYVGTFKMCVLK